MSAILSVEEHTQALAANFPGGKVWAPKLSRGSNLRGLLAGLAPTFRSMDFFLSRFVDQSIPPETEDFISEWEEALGLPDDCFDVIPMDLATRQRNVKIKLSVLSGVSTKAEFEALGLLFSGLVIVVNSGIEHVSLGEGGYATKLPVIPVAEFTGGTVADARMTMVVVETFPDAITFPWEFPLLFTIGDQLSLRCIIEDLAPAHVDVMFKEA